MCTDTVWRQPHVYPEAKIAIAWWHSQNKLCPPGTMCTDTVWWQPHAHSEAKIAIAWWHNTRTYAAHQGRCAQTPYGGSRTHTQRRRSQSHGAVPKWLIRLANPLRFSGPARPRDDKKKTKEEIKYVSPTWRASCIQM